MKFVQAIVVGALSIGFCALAGDSSLVSNPGFETSERRAPASWESWSPRDELAPDFGVDKRAGRSGSAAARIQCRRPEQIGAWTQHCDGIVGGALYRFRAFARVKGIASVHESVVAKVEWRDSAEKPLLKEFIPTFTPESDWYRVEGEVPAPANATTARIELGAQWCTGTVWWDDVCLERLPSPSSRRVRVSTVCFRPDDTGPALTNLALFAEKVSEAARAGADIVCLGEVINCVCTDLKPAQAAEPIPGPFTEQLGDVARRHRVWLVTSLYERDGARVYNTAVLVNREGRVAGRYRKTHLPEAEVRDGVTPGSEYPVFQTEFGVVGLQVCYDNFFPEVARSLAVKGAEIIFTPIWGDPRGDGYQWDIVARARAIDNAVYFVAAMYGPNRRSVIIDPSGRILADTVDRFGVVTADVELDRRRPERWLSVGSVGEWKTMYPKERRPSTYTELTREPANGNGRGKARR